MPLSKQGETKADMEIGRLSHIARWAEAMRGSRSPAPVDRWHPPLRGSIDIRIDRAGIWHHEGRPIEREGLVRLFASVLRREEDGSYALVTPAEKWTIEVDDVPFLAVDVHVEPGPEPRLYFLTHLGECVALDADHPLRIARAEGFVPYLLVRPGLEARLTRPVAAEIAGLAERRDGMLGLQSFGHFFVIAPANLGEPAP